MIREIKLLLVDDHMVVRNGIKLMLSQQKLFIPVIKEAANGQEAISLANQEYFDVVVLDINLPKVDGIDVTKALIKINKAIKILVLSMHKEDYIIKQIIDAGALGYLFKNTGIEELTKAIMTVSSSNHYYCNEVSQSLFKSNPVETKKKHLDLDTILSIREKEVMILIAKEFSSMAIAEKLCISKRTVDGHRKRILTKLNLKNSAGLVKYVTQNDLIK